MRGSSNKHNPNITLTKICTQVRVLRYVELPRHIDDLLHPRRLHLSDDSSRRRLLPVSCPVLLCPERPASLLKAASTVAD